MKQKDYEAKKALLKRIRYEWGRRLAAARGPGRVEIIERYDEARAKLSRFIRGAEAHRHRKVPLITYQTFKNSIFALLYGHRPDGPPGRPRPPPQHLEGDSSHPLLG